MPNISRVVISCCRRAVVGIGAALWMGCAPTSLIEVAPPNSVVDPSVVATAGGAMSLYNFAVYRFAAAFGDGFAINYLQQTGLMTDELVRVQCAVAFSNCGVTVDERNTPTGAPANDVYNRANQVRTEAAQAREALRAYAPTASPALAARLMILEGYSLIWLAEGFCSGVPLTTVPILSGSATLTRGFTTQEILERSLALFDSAITLAGDSARFTSFAKVMKGRGLLALGHFAEAAAAVTDVPTAFVYKAELGATTNSVNYIGNHPQNVQVVDGEGGNGLVWSTDPRVAIVTTPTLSGAMKVPAKYSVTSSGTLDATVAAPNAPIRAADGLEARLIEAEAALAVNDASWLTILNMLRATCVGTAACAPVPGLTAAALPPLTDPGTGTARLDLLMKERAMWLFLTGHREGDLRRLVRLYHRDPAALWPMGLYVNPGFLPLVQPANTNGTTVYGTVVIMAVPTTESQSNPLYTGCIDLNP